MRLQEKQENNKVIIEELETDSCTQEISIKKQSQRDEKNYSRRIVIEEVTDAIHRPDLETDSCTQEISIQKQSQSDDKKVSRRIIIEEVTDATHRPILDEICNCNDDTDQAFSKNTQEMFSIVQNPKFGKPKTKSSLTYKDKSKSSGALITSKANSSNKKRTNESNSQQLLTYEKEQESSSANCKVKERKLYREDTNENKMKIKECIDNFDIETILTQAEVREKQFF